MTRAFLKSLKGRETQNLILRSAWLILLAAAILTVAGCYETDVEVINASSAAAVYGLPGTYNKESGGTMTISAVPDSNDYRFRDVSKEGTASTGYIRAVPLRDNLYIVQVKYDNDAIYYLLFYQFTYDSSGAHYRELEAKAEEKRLDQIAQQYSVKIDWDSFDFVPYLSGSSSNILAFLRAHASLSFSS